MWGFIFPLCILFCFFTGFISLATSPLHAAIVSNSEKKRYQIKQIEKDLVQEKKNLSKFNLQEVSILDQLGNIEKSIEKKRRLVKSLSKKIRVKKNELQSGKRKLVQLEKSLNEIEKMFGKRLNAFYMYAKRGYLQILATSNGLGQLNNRIKYLKVIVEQDQITMNNLSEQQDAYRHEISRVNEQISVIAELEEDENRRLESIKDDQEQKVLFLARVHREKEFYETAVKELQLASQNLKNKILNFEKKKIRKKALPSKFSRNKGKLPMPYKGRIIKQGSRKRVKNLKPKEGIYIRGPYGADVKVVYPGRVDYSGQLKGFGQMIVVNHGARYFTIYANLLQRDKKVGEMVVKNEVIGQIGETGLTAGAGLYFEIRKGGSNLDPMKWLKVN